MTVTTVPTPKRNRENKLRNVFNQLADYYLSQDHEVDNLVREIESCGYETKKEMIEHYKSSLIHEVVCIQQGKREANKIMRENLQDLFDRL